MPPSPNTDPDHYYNNPEKLTRRRNFVKKLRDYSVVSTVVFGGALIADNLGLIEATPDVSTAMQIGTVGSAVGALLGEALQRSMGNRLAELQQPPEQSPQS